mmetsp:Transcript_224/g.582  ORF Transcript_224/g.582 Transcript_224/m.582 type:complete len:430 (-) Transcript_224:65-1354(-)
MLKRVQIALDEQQIRSSLHRKEARSRDVHAARVVKVRDRGANGGLELDDLVAVGFLQIFDDVERHLAARHQALDGLQAHPNVIGVEHLELGHRLELFEMVRRHLRDFEQSAFALVRDERSALDVRARLVRQLHAVLRAALAHHFENLGVDSRAEVVHVRHKHVLLTLREQRVDETRVVKRGIHITVAWRIPVFFVEAVVRDRKRLKRVFDDARIPRLVERRNGDVRVLVLEDDLGGILVGVEAVHQQQRHVRAGDLLVEILDLLHGEIQERCIPTYFNRAFWPCATHRRAQPAIELAHGELLQQCGLFLAARRLEVRVRPEHLIVGRLDELPVDFALRVTLMQVPRVQRVEPRELHFAHPRLLRRLLIVALHLALDPRHRRLIRAVLEVHCRRRLLHRGRHLAATALLSPHSNTHKPDRIIPSRWFARI